MDETKNKEELGESLKAHIAKQITMDLFSNHLDEVGFGDDKIVCQVCGHDNFLIPIGEQRDSTDYPVIVTMPMPAVHGKGVWCIIVICEKCSNTLFFNAANIVTRLKESGKL
ncbi:hypothetical protein ACNSPD_16880 [Yersinia enterocolitica]|uniref:hypothetical protein n=1 Tax=Yersinia TaxID=629 RepID=UPI003AB1C456